MAYAFASILRFLTPLGKQSKENKQRGIYLGWLDSHGADNDVDVHSSRDDTVTYADGLRCNLAVGWYEFRCSCPVEWKSANHSRVMSLPDVLGMIGRARQPSAYKDVIRSYLLQSEGGDLKSVLDGDSIEEESARFGVLETFVSAVSTLYARMVSGDTTVDILNEMLENQHVYNNGLATTCDVLVDGPLSEKNDVDQPMHYRKCAIPNSSQLMTKAVNIDDVTSVVLSEVKGQRVIDLHTHLLPPSHGSLLCLWGIDELLTYHYLVAEYFMTAPGDMSPERFYAMSKSKQVQNFLLRLLVRRYFN